VTVVFGDKPSIKLMGDDNILPLIISDNTGRVLQITASKSYATSIGVTAEITTNTLKEATLTGAGTLNIEEFLGQQLRLELQGAGDIVVNGRANTLVVNVSGSGDINAHELFTEASEVMLLGSGDVHVNARKQLNAEIRGAGDILYAGSPAVTKSILGAGEVISSR